jgi:hypothetical protein
VLRDGGVTSLLNAILRSRVPSPGEARKHLTEDGEFYEAARLLFAGDPTGRARVATLETPVRALRR